MSSSDVAALISNICESGDAGRTAYDLLPCEPSIYDVRRVFDRMGLRWNPVVEHDAVHAINGEWFDYFTGHQEFAAQAREEMGIPEPAPAGGVWRAGDIADHILARFERDNQERAQHGIAFSRFLENEWACPVEQARFYKTDAWRRCSAAQRYVWDYACRRCNVRGAGLHVHHNNPIMSGYGHNFDLNFAPWKLSLMCEDCHRAYHSRAVRNHAAHEYLMETEQEAAKDRAEIRQTWKVVHKLGLCRYCECHPYEARL